MCMVAPLRVLLILGCLGVSCAVPVCADASHVLIGTGIAPNPSAEIPADARLAGEFVSKTGRALRSLHLARIWPLRGRHKAALTNEETESESAVENRANAVAFLGDGAGRLSQLPAILSHPSSRPINPLRC